MTRQLSLLLLGLSAGLMGPSSAKVKKLHKIGTIEHAYGDELSNSCLGKADGEHWLLLSGDAYSVPVKLHCSNEYVVLDVSKDANLETYFSSFEKWHYAIGGPSNSNPVNWQDWFLPDRDNTGAQYLLSPDCGQCDALHERQVFGDQTAYYMTGNLAKLFWGVIGFNACDFDTDTYECYDCTSCLITDQQVVCEGTPYLDTTTDYSSAGVCGVAVQGADIAVSKTRKEAQTALVAHYKPSIGTDGRFCVCYQPDAADQSSYTLTEGQEKVIEEAQDVEQEQAEAVEAAEAEQKAAKKQTSKKQGIVSHLKVDGHDVEEGSEKYSDRVEDLRETNIVSLRQSDFLDGTLRIKKSGTYRIEEDIVFDFNKDDDYWPRSEQSADYEGAYCQSADGVTGCRDPYHLGFFAGITVEADYVTIDLMGHTLKQSLEFYYQQRWFALIELSNQQFLPGQGPAFFGPDALNIQGATIKNGVLGRTSHFAIHGNYPDNLLIEDVHIKDFVTHGLQINGWTNLEMNNVEIGPSSKIEFLRGDYAHARILRQRLGWIADTMIDDETIDDEIMSFGKDHWGKQWRDDEADELEVASVTMAQVLDEMDIQMEMVFDYAMNRARGNGLYEDNDYVNPKYTADSEGEYRWQMAKRQFIHESGLPSASSVTGLFLNFMGASVFSYAKITTQQSSNGKLSNIYIHDIEHDMVESLRFTRTTDSGQTYPTPWNSDFPAELAFESKDLMVTFRDLVVNGVNTQGADSFHNELSSHKYVGSVITDAYIAMTTFSDDWNYLGFLKLSTDHDSTLMDWSQVADVANSIWRFGCNQDIMGHSGKGLIGLRIDGVQNLELDNIRVENLESHSALGSLACGEYPGMSEHGEGGHFKQSSPMQVGFSGNNLQGISIISSSDVVLGDISVKNLESDYGEGYGISLWTANDISVKEDALIVVSNVQTGKLIDKEDSGLSYDSRPNRSPEACGVRMETDGSSKAYNSFLRFGSDEEDVLGLVNVATCSVSGHEVCLGNDNELNQKTMFGHYLSEDSSVCDAITTNEHLKKYIGDNMGDEINREAVSGSASHSVSSRSTKLFGMNITRNGEFVGAAILLIFSLVMIAYSRKYCVTGKQDNSGKNSIHYRYDTIKQSDCSSYGTI